MFIFILNYDGNFANGNIKIGGQSGTFYKLKNGETITNNESLPFEYFSTNLLSGEKYAMVETQENQIGGYFQTQKYMRYIGVAPGPIETNLLQYVIDLGDNTFTRQYCDGDYEVTF